jgi:hypothetical protein
MGMGMGMDGYEYGYGYGWVWAWMGMGMDGYGYGWVWIWIGMSMVGMGMKCKQTMTGQDYYLPRQTIRTNSNLLILFELPFIDMMNIHSDYIACDMPFAQFQELCNETYKVPYSFMFINKDEHPGSGKHFKNLNQLYIPQNYFSGSRSRLSPEFLVKECSIGVNGRSLMI